MILVIGHEKGGVGKSNLVFNAGYWFVEQGFKVTVVDTDGTSTVINWYNRRVAQNVQPTVPVVQNTEHPIPTILDLSEVYDVVIVDIGARDYAKLRDLAKVADLWIAPVQVGVGDLDSSVALYEAFKKVDHLHKSGKIPLVFAFNDTPTSGSEEAQGRAAMLAACPDVVVLESALRSRKVYRDAQKLGRSIFEFPARDSAKATAEFAAMLNEALEYRVQ